MTVPSPETAAHLARGASRDVVGSAFGVGLVRRRGLLENAGGTGLPGLVLDADGGVQLPDRLAGRPILLNDVVDLDGAVARVVAQHPDAVVQHRYDARLCAIGDEGAEATRREILSTSRRKRVRSDVRKLDEKGDFGGGWIDRDQLAHAFDCFTFALAYRAAETERWDRALQRRERLWQLWDALGTEHLLVHGLWAGGDVVSIRTGFRSGDVMVGHMPVVDRRDNRLSLGDVHMGALLHDMEAVGLRRYLMGKGFNRHKEVWTTGGYRMVSIVLPGAGRGVAVAAAMLEQRARRALTASGLEDTIRQALHWWFVRTDREYREALEQAMERAKDEG